MGKKRYRPKKVSKGERSAVSKDNLFSRSPVQKLFDRLEAQLAGKKVSRLIVNPDLENIRKAPYIRVVS